MTAEEIYRQELTTLQQITAKRDFSKDGKREYLNQYEATGRAYWAMYRASVQADKERAKQKKGRRK